MQKINVIVDNREQTPWNFGVYDVSVASGTLTTGDYTLLGYEDLVCIERKSSTGEISTNIGKKKDAFLRELNRMKDFKYRYLICEFPRENLFKFPIDSGIPERQHKYIRIHKNYLISFMDRVALDYNIVVLYTDGPREAERKAYEIFKEVIENEAAR